MKFTFAHKRFIMLRRDKINYYLDIADAVCRRSTCMHESYGAIIVKDDNIIATGYLGAPRGRKNCTDLGVCRLDKYNVPQGERIELCRAVHAEANAIIAASRRDCLGATMYLAARDVANNHVVANTECCTMCRRLIINAGITTVIVRSGDSEYTVTDVDADWVAKDDTLESV